MTNDANAFLMGGDKVPSASFLTKGTVHEGEILDIKLVQQTDPDTREPMTWKNGDPIMQVRVTVQTEERDYDEYEEDDGRRRFYLKYKQLEAVREAVTEALKEAGIPPKTGMEVGGWLGLEFTKQDKAASRVKSGVKHFEAWYEPPTDEQRAKAEAAKANEAMLGDDDDEGDEPEAPAKTTRQRGRAKAAEEKPAPAKRSRAKAAPVEDDADDDSDDDAADEPAEEAPKTTRGRGRATSTAKPAAARGRGRRAASDDADAF